MNKRERKLPGSSECMVCRACAYVCPKKCIEFPEDAGFFAPIINEKECIHCNRCVGVCPKINKSKENKPLSTFAAVSQSEYVRERCSSGGIAEEIACEHIKRGGIVYGAEMNNVGVVSHVRINTVENLYKIRGSKYVRSNLSGVFDNIKADLNHDLDVLFIGTPCQISAIKNVFAYSERLYTVDLVCHGIVPGAFFKEYFSHLKKKINGKVVHCEFRGRAGYGLALYDENERIIYKGSLKNDQYFNEFYYGWLMSKNCFSCEYSSSNRVSDITLGDFWGLGDNSLNTDLSKGISLVFTNTEKGELLFGRVSCKKEQRTLEEAVKGNSALRECEKQGRISKWFYYRLKTHGLMHALNSCILPMKLLLIQKNGKIKIKNLLRAISG